MYLGKIGMDPALAVYMKAPASYTGDDVIELQCHGGAAAADNALRALLAAGCRMAEPGEFTFRAFINGKMDLAQAEAVSDIITSGSSAAFDLAQKQLAGRLSERLNALYDRINALRSECEARLDFPDEELDFSSDDELAAETLKIENDIAELLATRERGSQLRDGVEVVLSGYVGPKAFAALTAAGIKICQDVEGITIGEAIENYVAGKYPFATESNKQ